MMIIKNIALYITVLFCLFSFVSCSKVQTSQMANEIQFPLETIASITISYDEENITFYESEDNKLVIKEYMTEHKSSYYARIKESNNSIQISEGGKPIFKDGFTRYIEVYLPKNYSQNLTVTSTSGKIDFSNMNLNLSLLRLNNTSGVIKVDNTTASEIHFSSTSGTLDLGHMQANNIRLETTSGSITCTKLNGNVTCTTTSGNIDVKSALGSGNYRANNSGKLNVGYSEVNGDLSFFNKNDDITLSLPADLEFIFEATTKNGSVSCNFQQSLTIDGRTTSGIVGSNPKITVKVETNNGDIDVLQ